MMDPRVLVEGAKSADGVIHLAFNHDFSRMLQNCEDDRGVIGALAGALAGSNRPLIVTSGTAIASAAPGEAAVEDGPTVPASLHPRAASEEAGREAAARGVNVGVVRLPQVHDPRRQGLVTYLIASFRAQGACAYVGDGLIRWAAGHVSDVARLYRLAIERAAPGAIYHAVGEEGVTMRAVAEALGRRLGLPVKSIAAGEAQAFFGWLAMFATRDMPASSKLTQHALHWSPTGPGMIADLDALQLADA
jgi:nucleoside-diphosphate-sugar epimerase